MAEKSQQKDGTKPVGIPAAILEQCQPGTTVKVHQILTEKSSKGEEKQRIQIFEGMIIARKHGKQTGSTITVRKVTSGVGVEKIFPLNSPWISKIEPIKKARVRRAKLNYLRSYGKRLEENTLA